jgi:hypothetical protein
VDDALSLGACDIPGAEVEAVLHTAFEVIRRVQPKGQHILGELVASDLDALGGHGWKNLPQEGCAMICMLLEINSLKPSIAASFAKPHTLAKAVWLSRPCTFSLLKSNLMK